jgi:hypothetical protein
LGYQGCRISTAEIEASGSDENLTVQQLIKITRGLSSPAILMVAVWCATLIGAAIGPVDYPWQPSVPLLVAVGVSLFVGGHWVGVRCFGRWSQPRPSLPAPPVRTLKLAVVTTSILGLAGIALIALDRLVLSGISHNGYAELMRCASFLVDFIEVKRTPVLYAGYLIFSFGPASLVLFLLRGEEVRGWAAILAQLSILSSVGYALLYSGRLPILLVIVLIIAALLVRIGQGRRPLPRGHHLLIKTIAVSVLFVAYSNAMWSNRREFCTQVNGLVQELREKAEEREAERLRAPLPDNAQPPTNVISAAELSKLIDARKASAAGGERQNSPDLSTQLFKREGWHLSPRAYLLSAVESGWLSSGNASNLLNTYFYLTHGVHAIDLAWQARAQFSPHWGVYEIGVLSPIFRIFFPQSAQLPTMVEQLKASKIHGYFPTAWAAAYIDFGAIGAIIYILIWGFAGGWSSAGARHSALVTPALLLTFVLASILLSPVQGPLGVANSALVLVSMMIVGIAIDLGSLRAGSARQIGERKPGTPVQSARR